MERRKNGQFGAGNKAGRGNPMLMVSAVFRDALKRKLTPERADLLADRLFRMAESDDDTIALAAIREIADRVGGKATDASTVHEIETLRAMVQELKDAIDAIHNRRAA